ncbi:MAG: hypothetical protein IPM29_13960 [Planctomycetes bacterium]|nr:hypothetical protein [Planctomycetota bacterium]
MWAETWFSPPLSVPAGARFYIGYRHPDTTCVWKNVAFDPSAPIALGEYDRPTGTQTWIGPCQSVPGYVCRPLMWRVQCSTGASGYLWDGEFLGWSSRFFGNSASSGSMTRMATGGNPGANVQVSLRPVANSSGEGDALLGLWQDTNVWDPRAQGAIETIALTIDFKTIRADNDNVHHLIPMVIQGGRYYVARASGDTTGQSSTWKRFRAAPRSESDFDRIWPRNTASHPDFSSAGAPLTIGFLAWTGTQGTPPARVQAYDNWRATVTPVRGSVTTFGAGCPTGVFQPFIGVGGSPQIGRSITLSVADHAPTGVFWYQNCHLFAGFSKWTYTIPGSACDVLIAPDVLVYVGSGLGGVIAPPLGIPGDPGLIGLKLHFQWIAILPVILTSDGATVVVGA